MDACELCSRPEIIQKEVDNLKQEQNYLRQEVLSITSKVNLFSIQTSNIEIKLDLFMKRIEENYSKLDTCVEELRKSAERRLSNTLSFILTFVAGVTITIIGAIVGVRYGK